MTGIPISRRALVGGAAGAAGAAAIGVPAVIAATQAGAATTFALNDTMTTDAAWASYLGTADMFWNTVPTNFYQGAFLGNGGLGAAVYQTGTAKRITWRLGDTRVRDHQNTGGSCFGNARLPVGDLTLNTSGDVTGVSLRQSMWHAELHGTITTTKGVLNIRTFAHAKRDVLVIAVSVASGTETVAWNFTPAPARSPRLDFHEAPVGLMTNPDPILTQSSSGGTCTQNLAVGGQTVTKWQIRTEADGKTKTLLATVAHTFPGSTAGTVASNTLTAAAGQTLDDLSNDHRSWWHAFWPKSFLSIPDTRLQSFYIIQLYKMACATRRDRPVIATHGPWVERTPWPAIWWNLNVELEYWLINATSHSELDSLSASLDKYRANLTTNVASQYQSDSIGISRTSQEDMKGTVGTPGSGAEVGDLTWTIHNAWLSYRHYMDDTVLRDTVFPLLRKAINYYLHFLTKDSSGKYHLPSTFSPEYAATKDCNYDLALIYWGVSTLLASAKRLGITDPLASKWQDVRTNLTKPPQDSTNGFWIGADVQLTSGHRHYSHLLWFYPLYQLNVITSSTNRSALTKSLNHWLSFSSGKKGYTFTGSGSMYALLGDGNHALAQLNSLLTGFVQNNTMYKEAGPVIETPLSGAQTMHDMVVQSWGGTIRVFPGIPTAWGDMTIHNLRTEGAFLVSAVRKGGKTQFVRVKSLAGEPCKVVPGNLSGPFDVQSLTGGTAPAFTTNSDGSVSITLAKGQDVVIITKGTTPDLTIAPTKGDGKRYWGLP